MRSHPFYLLAIGERICYTYYTIEKINKKIRSLFWWALGLSIGFPLGIVALVFGAIELNIPLLVGGILLVIAGFYAMPILWVRYGDRRQDRNLLDLVLHEHIYTVGDLARLSGISEKNVREKLKKMLISRELSGYLLVDDVLELNTNTAQTAKTVRTQKCANCGAEMCFDGAKFVCEYCGTAAK